MKRTLIITCVLVLALAANSFAIDAIGTTFGTLTTAQAIGQGKGDLGGGVGIADATSFFGTFRYGLSEYMDGAFKVGMYDPGDGADAEIVFGADVKWQMWSMEETTANRPFDMSLGGMFEYLSGDVFSVLEVGGFALGSYPMTLSSGTKLTPYGRANLRLEKIEIDLGPFGDTSESEIKFGINAGVAWEVGSATTVYGEFQLDGNDGVFLGIDFNVM